MRSCDAISPAPGFPCNQTTNIGDATIKGIEAEATLRDMGGFSADASLGYTGFSYDHVVATSGVAVGMRSVFNPEFTASLGGQYAFDTGKGTITPRIDIRHRSSIYTDAINTPLGHLPALQLVNARLTWDSPQGDWQASVAVTNLFNTFYAEATSLNTVVPYFAGSYILAQPRQWQVSLRRRF